MPGAPLRLDLLNVSYQYPDAEGPALAEVSLSLRAGECLLLLGHNGAGKTTLLHLLAGLLHPSTGRVRLEPEPPRDARAVGLVLQHAERQLFCASVFDEVAFGLRHAGALRGRALAERVAAALAAVGLDPGHFAECHPLRLSGGEQRRLAIACCLALEPAFVALDEPLVGLDGAGRRAVVQAIERLRASGRGVLVATHAVEPLAGVADRVLVLRAGRLVANGPRDEVLGDPAVLRQAGLEPYPLAEGAQRLRARGWPLADWLSADAFAASLLRARQARSPAEPADTRSSS